MTAERLTGPDRATILVERTLGREDTLRQLLVGKGKDTILPQVASEIATFDHLETACLLKTIFQDLAREGDVLITNRRDGALALLEEIVKTGVVDQDKLERAKAYDIYIAAVRQQNADSDPYAGSIYALLEAGKIIAPYLDSQKKEQITDAWEKVAQQFPLGNERFHIRFEFEEIKQRMSLDWFDAQVEQLRKQGLSNPQIAEQLHRKHKAIEASARRLIAAKRIEPGKRGRKPLSKS